METLIGGGLFTAVSAIVVALIYQGNRAITDRLDRIEDKLDSHLTWHLSSCPLFNRDERPKSG